MKEIEVVKTHELNGRQPDVCVCGLVSEIPTARLGSVQVVCWGCGELLWLGQESLEAINKDDVPTICKYCCRTLLLVKGITRLLDAD